MPSTPSEIQQIASDLWGGTAIDKRKEVCVRTVAGRSYYAAYTSTREAVRSAYGDPAYDVQHESLIKFLTQFAGTLQVAGGTLKSLYTARTRADYNLGDTLTHAAAEEYVDDALYVLSLQAQVQTELTKLLPNKVPRRT